MSIQTVRAARDRRTGLFGLVALLVLLATVGAAVLANFGSVKADVVADEYCIDENNPVGDTTVECDDDAPVDTVIAVGDTVQYKVSIGPLSVATLGNLVIVATVDDQIVSVVTPAGLPAPSCVIDNDDPGGESTVTCTYPGPIPAGTSGTLLINTVAVGGDTVIDASLNGVTADDASAQAAQAGDNLTDDIDVIDPESTFSKTASVASIPAAGATYNYTLGYNIPVPPLTAIAAGSYVITDSITDTDIATVNSVTAGAGFNCITAPATLPAAPPVAVTCTNTGVISGNSTAATISVTVAANPSTTATRVVTNTASASITTVEVGAISDSDTVDLTQAVAGAVNNTDPDLVHIDPFGNVDDVIDIENNVIGFFHTVCALNTEVDSLFPTFIAGAGLNFKITTTTGAANIIGPNILTNVDCDGDGFSDDSTITWYSTQTGEQSIEVVNDSGVVVLDSLGTAAPFNAPLVKEWNTLLPTTITSVAIVDGSDAGGSVAEENAAATNYDGKTVNLNAFLNPSTGIYEADSATYYENVLGSHVTNTGSTLVTVATGATVTFTVESVCGYVALLDEDTYVGEPVGYNEGDFVRSITVTSVGASIPFQVSSWNDDSSDCAFLDRIDLAIQAAYPASVLGSVVPTNPAEENISFQLVHTPATKQVLLAWAGQRIILEHDWRIGPGDYPDLDAAGFCPWPIDGQTNLGPEFTWIKGSGPGNFLPGLGVTINTDSQAKVRLSGNSTTQVDDVPGWPQAACITRVLFESEDPGQVDIEHFYDDPSTQDPIPGGTANYTKVAFVIYYMKFNSVDLSLVTQVSKPTHNGSAAGYRDYAPGNPWDASADDADGAAEWNVSKDILVRGRVTGWFVNANPSGRPADTSDPYNVLPANRWVLPTDWAVLAGGPSDPADGSDAKGTAEEFRPYYNLLFAPNNVEGIALTTPEGDLSAQVAVVTTITGVTNSATTFGVSTQVGFYVGQTIYIGCGTTARTIASLNANGTITISAAWSSVPAAGTVLCVASGVPFEGPYSLIDIPGLAVTNGGVAGAALSNILGTTNSGTRDTVLADGDIDWWDAPMPPAMVSVKIRGAGFIKQVLKDEVYYIGTPNTTAQVYPNPFYISNIPDSGFIPAVVAGGGYLWNSWANDGPAALNGLASSSSGNGSAGDGPYRFWTPARIGSNSTGVVDTLVSNPASSKAIELGLIRQAYNDDTIARDLVIYSDNHGEFMVTANGDFNLTYDECGTNTLGGGKLCAPGDKVGTSTITSTADYPDFRDKHFPVASNAVTVDWTWGGYKDVTIVAGDDPQLSYVVFHAVDRDGFCSVPTGAVSLHSVYSNYEQNEVSGQTRGDLVGASATLGNQVELVDFLIDSDEGGIILATSSGTGPISVTREFASGVETFSKAVNTTIKEFENSDLAASATADECQAWIQVSNSLLRVTNVLVVAHNDPPEGNVTFDRIVDFSDTATITLSFRWSLVTWTGADNIPVEDALKGTGLNEGGNDIFDQVTAVYGWEASSQDWLGYFPAGVGVPGANDLTALKIGQAYWIAIKGPSSVTWTIETNVDQ